MPDLTIKAPPGEEARELLLKMDAYWRAANYLSVGQIYLRDNPLLREPLKPEHVKSTLLGHWGTTPGQNFIYVHLNRVIQEHDLDMIYISGPGHGGPALVGNTYLEGTYSEVYPEISENEDGLRKLFKQFSYPGGIPSHVSPECPGSIHEGGELGYSLSHAFGAAFDNPDLIVACVVGDGEAETGPLATAWHSNKFLSPITDGAVLPILHLNGYKIANPAVLARIEPEELEQLFRGYGWTPHFVEGDDPATMHLCMAKTMDKVVVEIREIQRHARETGNADRPRWPMIVLRSPKGWTGPAEVDGIRIEGTFRAHQIPILLGEDHPGHLKLLEEWLKSYRPEELFDPNGRLIPELAELAPTGDRRMGSNPHANGGLLLRNLILPDFRLHAVDVPSPGMVQASDTSKLGELLREVIRLNRTQRNFRIFGPDETLSNRLNAVFEATNRQWGARTQEDDECLAADGRVMEMLSEHQCEGWLEGYLLTGRHGLFNCYEAFIHIIDSMFNQHAKWLKVSAELPWRRKIASLNYLLASHVWQQAHNGFTHQDPGFIDHVVNKKASVVRVYLPPDANCLLSVWDHCLRSRHYVNVVIAGKYASPQWLSMTAAVEHCTRGIGVWEWAGCEAAVEPDIVMACCGDVPTLETLAAVSILRTHLPALNIRVVNIVDLMKLQPEREHPHGLSDEAFDALFTKDKPILFAFHGYPSLIHRLTYRRTNHPRLHVRGYKEEGTITTYFDMTVLNDLDRFHLVMDAIDRLPQTGAKGLALKQALADKLIEHRAYIREHGVDMPGSAGLAVEPSLMSVTAVETRSTAGITPAPDAVLNTVGIAADHGGYGLKQFLIKLLRESGRTVRDFGDLEQVPTDDYPDFVVPLARAVAAGEVQRGVAICGSGVGACVVANKVGGVRAGLLHDTFSAHQGVEDDDLNLICLGGLVIGPALAWELVQTFLNARFSGAARHLRRLGKVAAQERRAPGQIQSVAKGQDSTASPPLQIHFIRHGETAWSVSGQHSGRADIPLTERGEREARAVGERLRGIPFSHVLGSPLRRAQQTVALAALGQPAILEPDLAEWDTGDDEGRTTKEILASRPGWNLFRDGSPNGESPAQVSARADRLITRLRTLTGNVALFSHSHFGRVLAARWIGLPVAVAQHFLLNPASVSILCYEHDRADQPAISLWNAGATESVPTAGEAAKQDECTAAHESAAMEAVAG